MTLDERVERLEAELAHAKHWNRWLPWLAVAGLALGVCALVGGAADPPQKCISANELKLVDENGKCRVYLTATALGEGPGLVRRE
jgi:hypothetical protein